MPGELLKIIHRVR